MCKNVMVVGVKDDKQKELQLFMKTMAPVMTAGADDHGFGYAAMTSEGIYGERWLNTEKAFKMRQPWTKKDKEIHENFKGLLVGGPEYNSFMEKPDIHKLPAMSVIMHARFATCDVSIQNTHPFYRDGVALIHNGVINNVKQLKQITSTCDSECILNSYVDNDVKNKYTNIDKVVKDLRGSYTCGVLTKDNTGTPVLDIFRSSPGLYGTYIKELDALVFCTIDFMIADACKQLGWKHSNFFMMKDDSMMRLNAATGNLITSCGFKSELSNTYSNSSSSSGWEGWANGKVWDEKKRMYVYPENIEDKSIVEIEKKSPPSMTHRNPKTLEMMKISHGLATSVDNIVMSEWKKKHGAMH